MTNAQCVHNSRNCPGRARVVRWMITEVEHSGTSKRIQSISIKSFPQRFRSGHSADFMRAKRLWEDRSNLLSSMPNSGVRCRVVMSVAPVTSVVKKRIFTNALVGRGIKCGEWVVAL